MKTSQLYASLMLTALLGLSARPIHANEADQPDIRQLDRLFTTRAERARLDAMRRGLRSSDTEANAAVSAVPDVIEMKGIMQRERGAPVVWVNEGNTLKSDRIDDSIRVKPENVSSKSAVIQSSSGSIRLKPGQVWEAGQVKERYQTNVANSETKGNDANPASAQTEASALQQLAQPAVSQP